MTPGFPVAAEISDPWVKQARAESSPASHYLGPHALVDQRYRQHGQCSLVAGELHHTDGQRMLGLVIE